MIGRIHGVLLSKQSPEILVDVNGVGYELEIPLSSLDKLPETGQIVTLVTHLQITENSRTLFGFTQPGQRQLFRSLLKISGVGGKMALAILSAMSPEEFSAAIQLADVTTLIKIPGVGKKTAERLVIELRDKVETTILSVSSDIPVALSAPLEARHALESLGYKAMEAERLVKQVAEQDMSTEAIIRAALQQAGGKR